MDAKGIARVINILLTAQSFEAQRPSLSLAWTHLPLFPAQRLFQMAENAS